MQKQLIVVVHGVGIRAAGESSDLVAGALDQGWETWRRRSSDDFRLFEMLEPDEKLFKHYPARLTRFRRYTGPIAPLDADERVIADFYWGDVGGFGASTPGALIGLARVMLGLVHVVRENARTVFPGATRPDRWARGLARGAALAVHGPIFAANVALFLGLVGVVLFGTRTADGQAVTHATLFGAVACLALAWFMQGRCRAFLFRHFAAYLAAFGLILLAFWATPLGQPGTWVLGWFDDLVRGSICSWMDETRSSDCYAVYAQGPFLHGMRLQAIMVGLWIFVSAVTLCFGLRLLLTRLCGKPGSEGDLLAPSLSLISFLWFMLIGLAWGAVSLAYEQVGSALVFRLLSMVQLPTAFPNDVMDVNTTTIFATSLRGIWAAFATAALLGIVGGLVYVARSARLQQIDPDEFLHDADEHARRTRLIVPDALKFALLLMPALILALIAASVGERPEICWNRGDAWILVCWLELKTQDAVIVGVGLIVAVAPFLIRPLIQGLYVAGDVIIYLNDFEWRRAPDDPPTRTFAERLPWLLRRRPAEMPPRRAHFFRDRIHTRLKHLVEGLIENEEPDRIDFVCHSQGTVIAIDVLQDKGAEWGAKRTMTLTTMGSPRRHLYRTYFPQTFPALTGRLPGLDHWTNIFRIDDFIGTHVGRPGEPGAPDEERPIGPGGHTNYWSDWEVREILQERLVMPPLP